MIFVAACDSEFIGRIFQRCGAKHVVCVKQQRFVLDEAAIQFTRTFYKHIFQGTPICTAFEAAKSAVGGHIRESEANLFVMLLKENLDDAKDFGYGWTKNYHDYEDCFTLSNI